MPSEWRIQAYATFAIRNDYLATINNLDAPVLKTAAKTMKVTYTLQEV